MSIKYARLSDRRRYLCQKYRLSLPWVPEPKNNKQKNKEGMKIGSGQMVTSIVGIDQWEAYIPNRVYIYPVGYIKPMYPIG